MIGQSPKSKDAIRLLRGQGRYVDDLTRRDLVHLGVVRSAHAHARITRVEAKAARAIPGVLAVWTAADVPELGQPLTTGGSKERGFAVPILAGERAAVQVDYTPLPSLVGADVARAASARVHADWPDNVALEARGAVGEPD